MTIFVRADESGVFDPVHNDFFIFAGLIFLDAQEMELTSRRYLSMEKKLRKKKEYKTLPELKATLLNHEDRRTLFRVTESCSRFCVIVKLSHLDSKSVFADKKSKQRYLDYAFKRGLKHAITCMAERGSIFYEDPAQFSILLDERTNASNGLYDLEESIYREMRGEIRNIHSKAFPAALPNTQKVTIKYGNSEHEPLLRCADVLANRILHECRHGSMENIRNQNLFVLRLPDTYR